MGAIIVSVQRLRYPQERKKPMSCNAQIAALVVVLWGRTIYQQFELLAGKSAPHDFLQLVIYKATTFSDEIQQLDTVRAYHVSFFFVSFTTMTEILTEWTRKREVEI
jgi:hypothetical protein